ncbi:PDDEXK family nuclease [Caulifigura coniformis]|uniref:NotI family restriction endonuclease n=1 Tax=Caulifigura coniformis TaxID=2527983 RepID=UPI0018D20359|nr:NotI family restriction endonuclease [Caulifigura coniformis]
MNDSPAARRDQSQCQCPFISIATGEQIECVKVRDGEPYGVCTISSDSNGERQDWIACPHRTLDQHFTLLSTAVQRAFGIASADDLTLAPVSALRTPEQQQRVRESFRLGKRVFLFTGTKLGGEVDFRETDASPGAAVDMSVIEVTGLDESGQPLTFGNHLLFEIQTSDFHGSPLHAAGALRAVCPRGEAREGYHDELRKRPEIAGTGVEGPNKANIFKRTIYQMIFKIELARDSECAGFAIILPVPVWQSWLRHLGCPDLEAIGSDARKMRLRTPGDAESGLNAHATVYVFDIDRESKESPSPLIVVREVEVSAAALTHHAFVRASNEAIQRGVTESFRKSFKDRVRKGWTGKLRKELKDVSEKPRR